MKQNTILKIVVDIGMTVMLLFLMTYELIGEAAHEWLGIGMFVLFIIHHILNRKWSRSVFKGKYTLFRIWQTVLVIGILFTMVGCVFGVYAFIWREIGYYMFLHNRYVSPDSFKMLCTFCNRQK